MAYLVNFTVDGIFYRGPNCNSRLNAQPIFSFKDELHDEKYCGICDKGRFGSFEDAWRYRPEWTTDETIWLEDGYLEFFKESRCHD